MAFHLTKLNKYLLGGVYVCSALLLLVWICFFFTTSIFHNSIRCSLSLEISHLQKLIQKYLQIIKTNLKKQCYWDKSSPSLCFPPHFRILIFYTDGQRGIMAKHNNSWNIQEKSTWKEQTQTHFFDLNNPVIPINIAIEFKTPME